MHINVVQNLASLFGREPMDYYLIEIRDFLNGIEKERFTFLGLSLLTVYQIKGLLPGQLKEEMNGKLLREDKG